MQCGNCQRDESSVDITRHHLRPVVRGGKNGETMLLCVDCHGHLHSQYTENHLRDFLSKPELVVADDAMIKFARFASKQRGQVRKRDSVDKRFKRRGR